MVQKVNGHIRYILSEDGIKTITVVLCLLTKEMPALVSAIKSPWKESKKQQLLEIDKHIFNVLKESEFIKKLQGIKIAA